MNSNTSQEVKAVCAHNANISCPCTKECPRHGKCCLCVAHHREHGNLPLCLRNLEPAKPQVNH